MAAVARTTPARHWYQVGDFGLWSTRPGTRGRHYLDTVQAALAEHDAQLYVVLGNHENYDLTASLSTTMTAGPAAAVGPHPLRAPGPCVDAPGHLNAFRRPGRSWQHRPAPAHDREDLVDGRGDHRVGCGRPRGAAPARWRGRVLVARGAGWRGRHPGRAGERHRRRQGPRLLPAPARAAAAGVRGGAAAVGLPRPLASVPHRHAHLQGPDGRPFTTRVGASTGTARPATRWSSASNWMASADRWTQRARRPGRPSPFRPPVGSGPVRGPPDRPAAG